MSAKPHRPFVPLEERKNRRERRERDKALTEAVGAMKATVGMALGHERIPRPIEVIVAARGWVYFVQANCGSIKIGRATNVPFRLAELQCANPHELIVVAVAVDGGREAEYHTRFAEHRIRGEWFAPHPEILAEIDRLNAGGAA